MCRAPQSFVALRLCVISAASTKPCASGEDVDLCWRLVEAGARLRYEPIAQVAHDHRTELRDWVARKAFYGGSAAPLSVRHPDKIAPLMISGWALDGMDPDGSRLELRLPRVAFRRSADWAAGREEHAGHRDPDVGRADGGRPQPVVGGVAACVGDLPALLAGRVAGGHCLPTVPPSRAGRRRRRRGGGLGQSPANPPTRTPSRSGC